MSNQFELMHPAVTQLCKGMAGYQMSGMPPRNCAQVVVVDESHNLKNWTTKRAKVILPLLKWASHAVMLSGTPALSKPSELFSQIQV